jgi:hypothetical protein
VGAGNGVLVGGGVAVASAPQAMSAMATKGTTPNNNRRK